MKWQPAQTVVGRVEERNPTNGPILPGEAPKARLKEDQTKAGIHGEF